VLKDDGIETVLSGIQMPRMNAIMERWVLTGRHELPGGPNGPRPR
jgi:putative transposase